MATKLYYESSCVLYNIVALIDRHYNSAIIPMIINKPVVGVSMQMELLRLTLDGNLVPLPSINGWIITLQRFDGTVDFYRGWNDYRNGFGDVGRGEFWLGNEKVHLLTAQPGQVYQLRIEVG